jgi:hypothetical protein
MTSAFALPSDLGGSDLGFRLFGVTFAKAVTVANLGRANAGACLSAPLGTCVVVGDVFADAHKLEIGNPVVLSVLVPMVDVLAWIKRAAKVFSHNKAMFPDVPISVSHGVPRHSDHDVAVAAEHAAAAPLRVIGAHLRFPVSLRALFRVLPRKSARAHPRDCLRRVFLAVHAHGRTLGIAACPYLELLAGQVKGRAA